MSGTWWWSIWEHNNKQQINKEREVKIMGYVYVDAEITNVMGDGGSLSQTFLVDTGAMNTVISASELEKIGVARKGKETYTLADGSKALFDVGYAIMSVNGRKTSGKVIFGKNDIEPLLGVTVLESAEFMVDPTTNELVDAPVWIKVKATRV
jgi:clan AA aspartic protease